MIRAIWAGEGDCDGDGIATMTCTDDMVRFYRVDGSPHPDFPPTTYQNESFQRWLASSDEWCEGDRDLLLDRGL